MIEYSGKVKNDNGFTLVELMIVVAIIGILAAIAIPQFAAYRTRAINASAKTVASLAKGIQADLNAELGTFGHTELVPANLTANDAGAAVADSALRAGMAFPASATTLGSRISGTNAQTNKQFSVPFGLGANMIADVRESIAAPLTCPTGGCSYNIHTRANRGDTAYGLDSDVESLLYSVSNPTWGYTAGGLGATGRAATDNTDNFAKTDGGGRPTQNWTSAF